MLLGDTIQCYQAVLGLEVQSNHTFLFEDSLRDFDPIVYNRFLLPRLPVFRWPMRT